MKNFPAFRRFALLAFVAGGVPALCRGQDVGADTPINLPTPATVRIFPNLAYLEQGGPRQKLDLYIPFPVSAKPVPVIVYFHGGGWHKGSKADGRAFAFRMVAQGYAVASIGYRLSSEAQFPAQLEDGKLAVRWLRDNAARYRLDPLHFGAVGVSAGGYLAALLGATGSTHLFDNGSHLGQSSSVQAVCDFFGPIDLLKLYEYADERQSPQANEVAKLLGGDPRVMPEQARATNPITYLEGDAPPYLLVHGTNDTVVPPEQSRLLYDALAKGRIPVHLHLIHEAGHTGPAFVAPDVNAMVDDFFSGALRPTPESQGLAKAIVTEGTARKN